MPVRGGAPQLPLPAPPTILLPDGKSIADVAENVMPSVVTIATEHRAARVAHGLPEPWSELFDLPRQRPRGIGSGVIVGSDGVILTNHHVVANADELRVTLHDGRRLDGRVVGTDPRSDLAVVRVEATGLPALPAADSSRLRVGDLVLAVGNPFGVGQTVTMGIISAVGRASVGIVDHEDFLQTDAAINPGNSGGALVDMNGKLVGINTAIVSRTGGDQGIGLAIPSRMALEIKDRILRDGRVVRGWLGVAIQDVDSQLAAELELGVERGVLISDVTDDSPAARAGVRRGDVVTAIDGVAMRDAAQLRNHVALAGKGKQVRVDLIRDGETMTLDVTLGELPEDQQASPSMPDTPVDTDVGPLAGVTVSPHADGGVVVADVDPDSDADRAGLRRGDVIVEVDRTPTPDVDAFRTAARAADGRTLLLVEREGSSRYVVLGR